MTNEDKKTQSSAINLKNQRLLLEDRKKLFLSSVSDVENFSDTIVVAHTSMGCLSIKGKDLKISKLNIDDGELLLEGRINILEYSEKKEKKSFFESIFK